MKTAYADAERILDHYGRHGWRLVCVTHGPGWADAYLIREAEVGHG